MKKNLFLTFCCACVPGCGQMYQGYMRRGASLAFWFWGLVFVAVLLNMTILMALMPIIWAFAFFDAFNIRGLTPEQQANFGDDFIPNNAFFKQYKLDGLLRKMSLGRMMGWGLILVGALVLYNTLFNNLFWYVRSAFPIIGTFFDNIIPLGVGIVVILLGVRMLRGKKNDAPPDEPIPYEWSGGDE